MIKKIVKRILYILPLVIGCILVYGIYTGKLGDKVNQAKDVIDSEIDKVKQDEKADGEATETISYPPGKISLTDTFEWYQNPRVEEYDPENKLSGNDIYGITVNEQEWMEQCANEQLEYNKSHPLSGEQMGNETFNPERVVEIGETFELKCEHLSGVVKNVTVSTKISDAEAQYFINNNAEELKNYTDDEGNLVSIPITHRYLSEDNQIITEEIETKAYFVTAEITLTSSSEWVQESTVVPRIKYLNDYGDTVGVNYDEPIPFIAANISIYNDYALYCDLGFYDYSAPENNNQSVYNYPMRKEEEVTFTVGYIIPEGFLEQAYLCYEGYAKIEERAYNDIYGALIKLT